MLAGSQEGHNDIVTFPAVLADDAPATNRLVVGMWRDYHHLIRHHGNSSCPSKAYRHRGAHPGGWVFGVASLVQGRRIQSGTPHEKQMMCRAESRLGGEIACRIG
jgi:hypothetical protein